jgi:hypothetical protein
MGELIRLYRCGHCGQLFHMKPHGPPIVVAPVGKKWGVFCFCSHEHYALFEQEQGWLDA